jgi:hypothetical protein
VRAYHGVERACLARPNAPRRYSGVARSSDGGASRSAQFIDPVVGTDALDDTVPFVAGRTGPARGY